MQLACSTSAQAQASSLRPRSTPARPSLAPLAAPAPTAARRHQRACGVVRASADPELESESDRKKAQAEKLRAAEKFMVVGSGTATCKGCGYEYSPEKGDPDFPVPRGVNFEALPADYVCPICGAQKSSFEARVMVVAGFAENQRYGLGGNSMTEGQKSGLIYGALVVFFALFISGYAMQ